MLKRVSRYEINATVLEFVSMVSAKINTSFKEQNLNYRKVAAPNETCLFSGEILSSMGKNYQLNITATLVKPEEKP